MNSILGFTAGATRAQAPVVMARLIINMLPARPAREILIFLAKCAIMEVYYHEGNANG